MTQDNISLRYALPSNNIDAMKKLAVILNIMPHKLVGDENEIVTAMIGCILYRHLDRFDQMSVMKKVIGLSHGPLKSVLQVKCLDSKVNPQWAEWSLTNEELTEILGFHNELNRLSSLVGGNPGGYGIGASVWSLIKQGKSTKNIAVLVTSLVIMGLHEFSYSETKKYSAELERRKGIR
ncbi:hypothetical protein [Moritella sp.]|uniref:hypothetical protein n=1 Tax=Moritella sp. TaxID=78556 RepID=UPI001D3596EB|nr:hypothetical protein [Moritella sp.]MCJ8350953.1 hypothetical protein [Moritella sp.]NQZ40795.1 hypothetical protein [Moritella sp.]